MLLIWYIFDPVNNQHRKGAFVGDEENKIVSLSSNKGSQSYPASDQVASLDVSSLWQWRSSSPWSAASGPINLYWCKAPSSETVVINYVSDTVFKPFCVLAH